MAASSTALTSCRPSSFFFACTSLAEDDNVPSSFFLVCSSVSSSMSEPSLLELLELLELELLDALSFFFAPSICFEASSGSALCASPPDSDRARDTLDWSTKRFELARKPVAI